jgi:hypothetical protein
MTPQEYNSITGLRAYTKQQEYQRTAELFEQIVIEQGAYFALAFLYDSGYNNNDLKEILNCMTIKPQTK